MVPVLLTWCSHSRLGLPQPLYHPRQWLAGIHLERKADGLPIGDIGSGVHI